MTVTKKAAAKPAAKKVKDEVVVEEVVVTAEAKAAEYSYDLHPQEGRSADVD